MKKIILDFSNSILTREQMKGVKGAYGSSGSGRYSCTALCRDGTTQSCSSDEHCYARDFTPSTIGFVSCGTYPNEEFSPCNL